MTPAPPGETIFALSSGAPPAAIAIVRVSGAMAGEVLRTLAGRLPEARRATRAALHAADGALIDRALVLWFPGPATATGEDLAEFHLHGGRAVVRALLDALAALPGLRPAIAGEFTRRALLNGRIDLTAAEGLADLLEAETAAQHHHALQLAEGGLGRRIEAWRRDLLGLSARIEAAIEFGEAEDDVGPDAGGAAMAGISALRDEMAAMLAAPPAERLGDGVRIVVAGPPNSGKSSLINMIAGREVALATPIAGTTRDIVEAPLRIGGHAVILADTAGLRETEDAVERLGVARARDALAVADLILWCGAPEDMPDPERSVLLATRCDEREAHAGLPVSIHWPDSLDRLRATILDRVGALAARGDTLLLNQRQRACVADVASELSAAAQQSDVLFVAEHLRAARAGLDALAGRAGVEDMLDALFGRFCIGK